MDYRGATATTVEIQVLNGKSLELSGASVFNRGFYFLNNGEPLSARDHRVAKTMVDPDQHILEIAPDDLAERRRSADAGIRSASLRRKMWSYSTHSDQLANIFHSEPPSIAPTR